MARREGSPLYEEERKEAHDLGWLDQRHSNMLEGSERQVERNLRRHAKEWEHELEDMFRRFRGEE
jgi:hypothetical protein